MPIFQVGHLKDDIKVEISQRTGQLSYEDALRIGSVNLEHTRLNLQTCSLLYEPQIFKSQLKQITYSVQPYESVQVNTKIVEYDSIC